MLCSLHEYAREKIEDMIVSLAMRGELVLTADGVIVNRPSDEFAAHDDKELSESDQDAEVTATAWM